jgi:hypothetical protein
MLLAAGGGSRGGASVRRWLGWASFAACGAAIAIGCGGSGGGAPFDLGDSGSTGDGSSSGSASGSGSTSGGSGSSSGSFADSGGGDATTGSSTSSGGGIGDATLDIAFPDSFFGPDTSASGSSGGPDSTTGDGGTPCSPNGVTCQGSVAQICSSGTLTTTDCSTLLPPHTCANGFGCVVCQPGTGTCNGSTGTACNSSGTATTTYVCDPLQGETCDAATGQCDGDCANVGTSYIGCEYYAVTMLNHLLNQGTFYFSVSLSNTSTVNAATVNIQGGALATPTVVTIPAGQLSEVKLPWVKALSCGPGNKTGTCNGDQVNQAVPPGTTLATNGAYHIRSTEPLTAYEFNARDYQIGNAYSYTNDASLLLPVNAMTGAYHVASWPTFGTWPGLMTVIATVANTQVTVAATNPIQPYGALTAAGGTITLANAGDTLQIMSALNAAGGATYGKDPSGTSITANNPIEVFGGHSCVYINTGTGYCDHLEQVSFPDETLRGEYLVTVPFNQNATPQQWVKIVGTKASTHIAFDPPVAAAQTINAGTVVTLQGVTQNFHVYSTDSPQLPFSVAQYMVGQNNFGVGCVDVQPPAGQTCGDPSMSLAVATPQFRSSYQFSAPQSYYQNWVNVIAPVGAVVTVDGATVTGYAAIGASGYQVAHVNLCGITSATCNPVHLASGTAAFGIEVYGYGAYTSYMYPGGLNLTRQ